MDDKSEKDWPWLLNGNVEFETPLLTRILVGCVSDEKPSAVEAATAPAIFLRLDCEYSTTMFGNKILKRINSIRIY